MEYISQERNFMKDDASDPRKKKKTASKRTGRMSER